MFLNEWSMDVRRNGNNKHRNIELLIENTVPVSFVRQNTKRTPLGSSLVTVGAEFEFILEDLRIGRLIRWVNYESKIREFIFY